MICKQLIIVEVIEIDLTGRLIKTKVGPNFKNDEHFQYTVKAGHWFAPRVFKCGSYSFVGCTVSPGFDFQDFELANHSQLISLFPEHRGIISELTNIS